MMPENSIQPQPESGRSRNAIMISMTPSIVKSAASITVSVKIPVSGKNANHPPTTM